MAKKANQAAVGFRVKSGRAVAVLLEGPVESPQVHDRREIDLCDPAIPETRQPYHAAMGKLETNPATIERRRAIVLRAAKQSFIDLLTDHRKAGHPVGAVGLVVGSRTDPARITNPHIRAHALEGQLFRSSLEDAARSCGLACSVILEHDAYRQAADGLGMSEEAVKQAVACLGRGLGGPWRADEKTAAAVAWLALV